MPQEAFHIGFEDLDPSLSDRTLLFLDTNIWINLAERRVEGTEECATLLAEAVSAGRLLCPLAAPLLWELYKQNYPSALRVAALMDQLSLSKLNNLRLLMPVADQVKIVAAEAKLPLDGFKSRLVPFFKQLPSQLVQAEVELNPPSADR